MSNVLSISKFKLHMINICKDKKLSIKICMESKRITKKKRWWIFSDEQNTNSQYTKQMFFLHSLIGCHVICLVLKYILSWICLQIFLAYLHITAESDYNNVQYDMTFHLALSFIGLHM